MRIAYLIPEFPGQTHIWMWREIEHLRSWGMDVEIVATRRPPDRDRARHAFADEAERTTTYLWPTGAMRVLGALLWCIFTRPLGLLRCIGLTVSLPVDRRPRWLALLPLVPVACILARVLARRRVEHVHTQSAAASAVLCLMAKELVSVPYSLTVNAYLHWWGGAMREKLGAADFVVTHARWLQDEILDGNPDLDRDRVIRASVGIDTTKWQPPPDERDGHEVRLVSVGRLHRSKGHDLLMRSLAMLRPSHPTMSLTIIGDGPDRGWLESLCDELGLAGVVTFTGSLGEDDVVEELGRADIFVGPSRVEALGVVFMEAMAMELATVGTSVGGIAEVITDGVTGVIVPPEDPQALADALRRLADDPALRRDLGRAARLDMMERYDSRIGAAMLFERFTGAKARPTEQVPCRS